MSDEPLDLLRRLVWLACVGVYLVVFVGGVLAGTSDLVAMLRAAGLSVATAVLGRLALGVVSRASQPAPEPPSAGEDRTLGSLLDLVSSPNVAGPHAEPEKL
jgi:hypothetical protein